MITVTVRWVVDGETWELTNTETEEVVGTVKSPCVGEWEYGLSFGYSVEWADSFEEAKDYLVTEFEDRLKSWVSDQLEVVVVRSW